MHPRLPGKSRLLYLLSYKPLAEGGGMPCAERRDLRRLPEEEAAIGMARAERGQLHGQKLEPATGLSTCMLRFTRAARLSATLAF